MPDSRDPLTDAPPRPAMELVQGPPAPPVAPAAASPGPPAPVVVNPGPPSSEGSASPFSCGGTPCLQDPSKRKKFRPATAVSLNRDDGYCSSSSTPKSSVFMDLRLKTNLGCYAPVIQFGEGQLSQVDGHAVKEVELTDGSLVVTLTEDPEPVRKARPTWDKKTDFLLSIIGFAVDLANVWRFPYLCYRNGGGVFLIPYTIMLVFGALPLFYMELVLGQYNKEGPISIWKICPLFQGVGYCAMLISWYVSFYYNVIISWAIYFIFSSFKSELPWMQCGNDWNTEQCHIGDAFNGSAHNSFSNRTSPAIEFFERAVLELHMSPGMHDLGAPKWQLLICLVVTFIILYFSLFKGVSSSGKVVWFTATAPYVILTILLGRGIFLPGALEGIQYYLRPDVSKLLNSQVWVDAAVQVFYSVGVGFGVHLTYASYNPFNNNCYRDCLVTTAVNSFTSFFSGFVIFVYLGYMAQKHGVPISEVATEGHGLVFQVYPEAISTLPGGQFWSVLFFIMLLTLGLDSAMGGLESVITGLMDEYRTFFDRWRYSREVFTAFILLLSFSVAIVNITRGGGYMVYWFDTFAAGISLLCSALFEAIGVAWIYGLDRFCANIEEMLGFTPGIFWRIAWKFISPTFLIAVIVSGILNEAPLQYQNYLYPTWSITLGWALALSSVAAIPIVATIKICMAPGDCAQKVAHTITPKVEQKGETESVKRFKLNHWTYV